LEERESELIARVVANAFDTAELGQRPSLRFFGEHAGAPVLFRLLIDVKVDLFLEAAFEGGAVKQ
jgi:hypothetical protein